MSTLAWYIHATLILDYELNQHIRHKDESAGPQMVPTEVARPLARENVRTCGGGRRPIAKRTNMTTTSSSTFSVAASPNQL